ncbi:hypothetical protein VTH82DRAFT_3004 [Thermothelomyces myriococcoides]
MSYQYPPPPQNGEMDMSAPGYMATYSVPSHASAIDQDASLSSRERSDLSRPGIGPSPAHPQQQTSTGTDPSGERRRNKLGYHRTSVACGHCRRRKIRCVPSPNDVQGRCINCIRLKKECSFYPVDQQPPVEARQKSGSRSSVGPKAPSASSSPGVQPGIPAEAHGQQPYPQLSMQSLQNMAPPLKPSGGDGHGPDAKVPNARGYEYGQPGMSQWMSTDVSPSSKPGDMNASWRSYPGDSPITTAFSPYTPQGPPHSATWSAPVGSDTSSRDDIAWSAYPAPTPRSMSFGGESMSGHQQYPSLGNHSARAYDRKSSSMSADMYPPPIATTIPGIETAAGTPMDHAPSLSAGAMPPSTYAPWQQSYTYSKPAVEGYAGWYGDAADQSSSTHGHASSNVYYGR